MVIPPALKEIVYWLLYILPDLGLPTEYIIFWLQDSLSSFFLPKSLGKKHRPGNTVLLHEIVTCNLLCNAFQKGTKFSR